MEPSGPVGSGPSSFSASVAAVSSPPSTAAAAPASAATVVPVSAPAPTVLAPARAFALAPAANAAGGFHRCPHCHKMGSHRPEECRSAPQNSIYMPSYHVSDETPPARPQAGVKKSRRRRGRKPGQRAKDAGRKPEDKDPGEGGAGCGGGIVPA
ncbi:hypothetical protein LRP88_01185 [Fusarium phalaenopsidis]